MENTDNKSYPSVGEQGQNLAKFTFQVIKKALQNEALFVSSEVKQERLAICRGCDRFDPGQNRCKECGCFLDQKASYAIDSCPLHKWDESDVDWTKDKFNEILESINGNQTSERDENQVPNFPLNPVSGDSYHWNGHTWVWNGVMWDFDVA
jgi:hypothetical protein